MNNNFYTVKQVADLLGFSTNTVYKYLDEGRIKATRVEKEGRFRIPESEVARLLGIREKKLKFLQDLSLRAKPRQTRRMPKQSYEEIASSQASPDPRNDTETAFPEFSDRVKRGSENLFRLRSIGISSLFDWFVGTLSIFLGLSHLLFSAHVLSIELEPYKNYIAIIKFGLVGFGIFLIGADIFRPRGLLWHKLAHIQLGALFLVLALIFFQAGLLSKVVGNGAIAILLILAAFTKLSEKVRFIILINLLAIFAGFVFVFFPQNIGFPPLASWASDNQLVFGLGWYGLASLVLLASILGFYRQERFLIFGAFLVGVGSLTYAILAFGLGLWEDVIYNIVLASFIIVLPFWHRFENFENVSKRHVIEGFAWFVAVLSIGFGLVFYLQSSFKSYVALESKRSLETSVARVESYFDQAKLDVNRFKNDQELITLFEDEKKDPQKLGLAARRLFLDSGTLRRVLIYDKDGQGIALYPSDPAFIGADFSDRDYLRQAKNTKKTVLTESIVPRIQGPAVIVLIATPILSDKGEVLGVIAGYVDLVKLNLKLSEVKFGKGGYFVVASRNKRIVLHPENSMLYSEVEKDSVLEKALMGQSGQIETYDRRGKLSLQTYTPVNHLGWGIVAKQPMAEVFQHQSIISFVIFLMTIVMGVGSLLAIIYLKR